MTPEVKSAAMALPAGAASDCERALVLLRQQGANRLNPVDFHYMEALARRLDGQGPKVRRILEARLSLTVAAYQAQFELAQTVAENSKQQSAPAQTGVQNPLGQLVSALAQQGPGLESTGWTPANGSRFELKSVRNFRNTWSRLSAQKQVSQALGQAPKNAGPINSHMLVLRSLELMRDISPDYLNRFMSYADTLLCLDQSDLSAKASAAKPLASVKPRSRTPARP